MDYGDFLKSKAIFDPPTGIADVPDLADALFPFQRDIVAWALRRGRAALFAGTGLGKSLMELAWGRAVAEYTGKPVLHLAPLAVAAQLVREAYKFGIPASQVTIMADCDDGINVTNYQKLDHFDLSRFGGIILDESSILKNQTGHYRTQLIEAAKAIPFRLAATATPAPNDFMELGNHAEFLGVMSYTDMLSTFFVHDGGETQKWRLKGHAENEFWRWMASWSVMIRKPSDLGYDDAGYDLPPLVYHQHMVQKPFVPSADTGTLFPMVAQTMQERLAARRDTVAERVALAHAIALAGKHTKLAECHGSQNMPQRGAKNINPTQPSASAGFPNPEVERKTNATCESTLLPIPKNTSNPTHKETEGLGRNTELDLTNTKPCLLSKAENAQSAAQSPPVHGQRDCMSTIVTKPEKSEDCFAQDAITDLDISKTAWKTFEEPWCIWCNLNSEQDALAKLFGDACFSVRGSMSDDEKEAAILGWIAGDRPVMISKPTIMGFGMNFQHCRNTIFVGLNDSWEQFYQAVRRFWRFGQTQQVNCHIVAADTEGATVANIKRKETDAERMASSMVMHMADLSSALIRGSVRDRADYSPTKMIELPDWLTKDVDYD